MSIDDDERARVLERASDLVDIALTGRDVASLAHDAGVQLYDTSVPIAPVVRRMFETALETAEREPHRAIQILRDLSPLFAEGMGGYEFATQRQRDNADSQQQVNDSMRRQRALLEEANAQLTNARNLAEEAVQAKALFLANMSHEIRTPLNAVVGLGRLLSEADLSPQHAGYVATICESADHLLALINDILDLSKLQANGVQLETRPFHLMSCLEVALDFVSDNARAKGLEIGLVIDPVVPEGIVGDELRLRQVVLNLLSNAVKFTAKGAITVEVTIDTGGSAPRLAFSVTDQGMGMSDATIASLFDAFTQADVSTTREFGGTGLGLAIVHSIVELMGGEITVESRVGVGSRFSFDIPLIAATDPVLPPVRYEPTTLNGTRLLVVDDFDVNLRIVANLAQRWGAIARVTSHADEAISWVEEGESFDVALIADQLEGAQTGPELAHAIHARKDNRELPVVLLKADDDQPDDPAEFTSIVRKPIKASTLFDHLAHAVGAERLASQRGDALDAPLHPDLRIVVAEDGHVNRIVAQELLSRLGYTNITMAENGEEALNAVLAAPYDVVLMDVQMPVMDGVASTDAIRRAFAGGKGRPRIIAVTADALAGDREKYLAAGMDDYMTKPIQIEELAEKLRRCRPVARETGPVVTLDDLKPGRGAGSGNTKADLVRARDAAMQSLAAVRGYIDHGDVDNIADPILHLQMQLDALDIRHRIPSFKTLASASPEELMTSGIVYMAKCRSELEVAIADLRTDD